MKRIFIAALLYVVTGISVVTHIIGLFLCSSFVVGFLSLVSFIGIAIALFYTLNQCENLRERIQGIARRARSDIHNLSWQAQLNRQLREDAAKNAKNARTELEQLQEQHAMTVDAFERARLKLAKLDEQHPDISIKLDELVLKEQTQVDITASRLFDEFAKQNIEKPAIPENERLFKAIIDKFDELTDSQKKLVHSNIETIRSQYDQCRKLRWQREQQERRRREEEQQRRRQQYADDAARRSRTTSQNIMTQILRS